MLQRVRVKIEGLREPATALKVAQMGADAIGMVFAESPRWVSPEQARAIVDVLPPWVAAVGVFVNADAETINRVVQRTHIGYVQLHGDEPPEIVGRIDAPCIKAFRVRDEGWLSEVGGWLRAVAARSNLAAILLDAYNPAARGGTGSRFNWEMVADARAAGAMAGMDPIVLAVIDQDLPQRAALQELHSEEEEAQELTQLEGADDVGVDQIPRQLDLTQEPLPGAVVHQHRRPQHLEGYHLVEGTIVHLEHDSHPAGAKPLRHLISFGDPVAGREVEGVHIRDLGSEAGR